MERDELSRDRLMELGVEHCRVEDWETGVEYLARAFADGIPEDRNAAVAASYLGYAMVRRGERDEGLALCRRAERMGFFHPEVARNLARARLETGDREGAVDAVRRGLAIDPDDPGLLMLRTRLGERRSPVIGFLSRTNLLNRLLGRIRHDWED